MRLVRIEPLQLHAIRWRLTLVRGSGAEIGEHTRQVLIDAGFAGEEIDNLVADGAVGSCVARCAAFNSDGMTSSKFDVIGGNYLALHNPSKKAL